jgi:hypothetical protein
VNNCHFVISLKRTGHHAFIDWFAKGRGEPVAFFNNAFPTSPPTLRSRPLYYGNHPHLPGLTPSANLRASQHDVILNFEGRQTDKIEGACRSFMETTLGRQVTSIYFLRDPLNCVASMFGRAKNANNLFYLRVSSQVYAFESIVNWIADKGLDDQLVTYSGWRFDESERASIAERFDMANLPPPEKVSKFGGGSSFGKVILDGHDARNELLSRWRMMRDDPRFLAVFCDLVSCRAFQRYFEIAGARELQDGNALDDVMAAARQSAEAQAIFHEKMEPFRRQLPLIQRFQSGATKAAREFFRVRIQLATGLLLHKC